MEGKISLRQYLVLLCVGLLSPLVKMIPGQQAKIAGQGGWLAVLEALIPALAVVWFISAMGRSLPEDAGLGEMLCLCLGKWVGRALCVVYGLSLLLISCIALRFCAERFTSTIYPDTGLGLFFLTILALEWWLGRRKLAVTARVGQIFFFAIVLTLGVVLVMAIGNIHIYNVWPIWFQDLPAISWASVPVLGTMGVGIGTMFFFGEVTDRRDGRRLAMRWVVALCLLLTALGFVVMGVFGPNMAVRLQVPFFSLAKEVMIEGAVERVETLVVAMWVFADMILLAILLRAIERALSCVVGTQKKQIGSALLLAVLPMAYLVAGSAFALEWVYNNCFLVWELVLFYLIPLVAMIIGKCRRVL